MSDIDYSDDDDYSSLEDEETNDLIYVEDDVKDLPRIFNSSSRRKKTISDYIAPQKLWDTVYRCQEYPQGVYINKYGQLCPDDPKSNIYKTIDKEAETEPGSDTYDYAYSEESETEDEDSSEEETPWEDSSEEVSDDSDNPWEKDEREYELDNKILKRSRDEDSDVEADLGRQLKRQKKNRFDIIRSRKLNDRLSDMYDSWKELVKNYDKKDRFVMSHDSNFLIENPSCVIYFKRKNSSLKMTFDLDIDTFKLNLGERKFDTLGEVLKFLLST